MRAMWKGAVSFGLVSITVRLYAATEEKSVRFRQVHRDDGGRITLRRFCDDCETEVPYRDIAKGYEFDDGRLVVVTDDELAELPLPTVRTIEVLKFVHTEEIDPILYNRTYYLEPEDIAVTPYALLRNALRNSRRVAIAKVALRQVERLAAIRERDGMLVLQTMLWPDELREPDFPFLRETTVVRPSELAMTISLIDSMTDHLDPDGLRDGYRTALLDLLAAKAGGDTSNGAAPDGPALEDTTEGLGPGHALQRGRVARTA
ncbi:Ku protein [Micromonospora sp. NPDC047620]|uniref:non-homologous end joining protein Ku n=1 Tax=Micromonospora sp. NPDC047620 TaxID=3364251 RepID=UPI0037225A32